jgi:hypothetical protein
MSSTPAHADRPTIVAMFVGAGICVAFAGTSPSHPGPVTKNVPARFPVPRVPTYAKLFDHASTNWST